MQRRMTSESVSSHFCANADEIRVALIPENTGQQHFGKNLVSDMLLDTF